MNNEASTAIRTNRPIMANDKTIRSRLIRLSPSGSGVLVIVALIGAAWLAPMPFERLRLATFDLLQRAFPWNPPDVPVTVVDVDEPSLARYGQWPWPRSELAALVDRLRELGAASLAFDMVFAEPDRTSQANAIAQLPVATQNELKSAGSSFPDNDRTFAAAIGEGGVTLGFGLIATPTPRPVHPKANFAIIGGDPASTTLQFAGTVLNIPVLEDVAAGLGSISIVAGTDEIVRRMPLVELSAGQVVPSLALEALRVATGEPTVRLRLNRAGAGGAIESMTLALGDMDILLYCDGARLLHHRAPGTTRVVSAANVLDNSGDAMRAKIKNHIVFIGTSALGLADLRPTPLNAFEPGINLQAAAATQVLAGHFLKLPRDCRRARNAGGRDCRRHTSQLPASFRIVGGDSDWCDVITRHRRDDDCSFSVLRPADRSGPAGHDGGGDVFRCDPVRPLPGEAQGGVARARVRTISVP